MTKFVITIDIDWAGEDAIEETLQYFLSRNIPLTVFTTHHSKVLESHMGRLLVGLHPFFGKNSSHGNEIAEIVKTVMDLPHNLAAFRCHRFGICNTSKQAMYDAGMKISSNVCTDMCLVPPFRDRIGLLEVPIFLEDGGYLWNKYPLQLNEVLHSLCKDPLPKVLLIHPMHFVLNTPNFNFMLDIKQSLDRVDWQNLSLIDIKQLRWQGRGIRDFIVDLLATADNFCSLLQVCRNE